MPSSCLAIVRHEGVPALCARLLSIEYIDLAEQCLQALEKLSTEHPQACLRSGALLAVRTQCGSTTHVVHQRRSLLYCTLPLSIGVVVHRLFPNGRAARRSGHCRQHVPRRLCGAPRRPAERRAHPHRPPAVRCTSTCGLCQSHNSAHPSAGFQGGRQRVRGPHTHRLCLCRPAPAPRPARERRRRRGRPAAHRRPGGRRPRGTALLGDLPRNAQAPGDHRGRLQRRVRAAPAEPGVCHPRGAARERPWLPGRGPRVWRAAVRRADAGLGAAAPGPGRRAGRGGGGCGGEARRGGAAVGGVVAGAGGPGAPLDRPRRGGQAVFGGQPAAAAAGGGGPAPRLAAAAWQHGQHPGGLHCCAFVPHSLVCRFAPSV